MLLQLDARYSTTSLYCYVILILEHIRDRSGSQLDNAVLGWDGL